MNPTSQILDSDNYFFDRLPDDIVFTIFDKLQDARSLCLSMSVCKRFHSIAPQAEEIYLPIPRKNRLIKDYDQEIITHKSSFKSLVISALMKPINYISQLMKFNSRNDDSEFEDPFSYHAPNDALKPFDEMRKLHLRLPCHGRRKLGSKIGKETDNSTTLLKWKAEFGSQLQSCVIIGAKSWSENFENQECERSENESTVIPDSELKLRIVWTISCLIAASARHYLIQEIVKDRKKIEDIMVSDESDQGVVVMNKEQIEEMRDLKGNFDQGPFSELRSKVPALRMKMWYAEKLELPGYGKVMEGATVIVISPAKGEAVLGRSDGDLVAAAFGGEEKALGEVARKLVAEKKCYTVEMNSF